MWARGRGLRGPNLDVAAGMPPRTSHAALQIFAEVSIDASPEPQASNRQKRPAGAVQHIFCAASARRPATRFVMEFSTTGRSDGRSWVARKLKFVPLSTCEAEIAAMVGMAKEVMFIREILIDMGENIAGPTIIHTTTGANAHHASRRVHWPEACIII